MQRNRTSGVGGMRKKPHQGSLYYIRRIVIIVRIRIVIRLFEMDRNSFKDIFRGSSKYSNTGCGQIIGKTLNPKP